MALHLIKLAVGAGSVEDLRSWQKQRTVQSPPLRHRTRSTPRRTAEILDGGSIYWVIRGTLSCRQAITAIEKLTGEDGIPRCRLVFDPRLVPVSPRPCRPFQGWRYLTACDAPADLGAGQSGDLAEMPEALRRELVGLGLL